MDLGVENRPKIEPKSVLKVIKHKMQFQMDLGGLLERFGEDFGFNLGGKLGPSWHQDLTNGGPKTMSKKVKQKGHASSCGFTQVTRVRVGGSLEINTIHHSREGHGALDIPLRTTRARWRIYIYVYTCMHIYLYIHIYIYTCIHMWGTTIHENL